MACVQGTWWGVGGGVVGGWRGSRLRCRVSGWGWVLRLGCLVGGGVLLVGSGSWVVGWCGVWGLFPLDPSLTPPPGRLVGCGSWFGSSLCWVVAAVGWWLSCGLQFFSGGVGWSCGWLVLLVVFWSGCSWPGVVVDVLVGCSGLAAWLWLVFRGCGLCGLCSCRGVVLLLAVSFPLGGPTWTVGLFVAPPFPPPLYTATLLRPPDPVGKLTR